MSQHIPDASIVQATLLTRSFTKMAADIESAEVRLQSICPPALLENARLAVERAHLTTGLSYLDALRKVAKELIETGGLIRG